jgi:hypothetical protein
MIGVMTQLVATYSARASLSRVHARSSLSLLSILCAISLSLSLLLSVICVSCRSRLQHDLNLGFTPFRHSALQVPATLGAHRQTVGGNGHARHGYRESSWIPRRRALEESECPFARAVL